MGGAGKACLKSGLTFVNIAKEAGQKPSNQEKPAAGPNI